MKKQRIAICLALILIPAGFAAHPVLGLEKLTSSEMRSVTGQAGISAAINDAPIYIDWNRIKLQDTETYDSNGTLLTDKGYMTFDITALLLLKKTIDLDIGVFQAENQLSFTDEIPATDEYPSGEVIRYFDHPLNNTAMIALHHASTSPGSICNFENISVYNHDLQAESLLGDLNFSAIQILESELLLYPPAAENGCGIRGMTGMRMQIDSLTYENPDQEAGVLVSGAMLGSAFTGDTLPEGPSDTNQIDTSTWAFDAGMFQMGIPYYFHDDPSQEDTVLNSYPFSLDITTDENRPGDFQSYMAINAPMKGSIRIKNISSDNFDMGPIAIDGIRLYKNVVEFPGRGIGN